MGTIITGNQALGGVSLNLKTEIVDTLPTIGKGNILYLVKKKAGFGIKTIRTFLKQIKQTISI